MADTVQNKQKQLLLEVIIDVIDGKAGKNELEASLDDSKEFINNVEQNFAANLNALNPNIKQKLTGEINQINYCLRETYKGFGLIEKFLQSDNLEFLFDAAELLDQANDNLFIAFDMFTTRSLIEMGPTEDPLLNLLIRTVEDVKAGVVPAEHFGMMVQNELMLVDENLKALEAGPGTTDFDEARQLKQAFNELKDVLKGLVEGMENNNWGKVDKTLSDARKLYPHLQKLLMQVNSMSKRRGPTKVPMVNVIINTTEAYNVGIIPEQIFMQALDEAEIEYEESLEKFFKMKQQQKIDAETVAKAQAGFNSLRKALDEYIDFADTHQPEYIEKGKNHLKEAAGHFEKAGLFTL